MTVPEAEYPHVSTPHALLSLILAPDTITPRDQLRAVLGVRFRWIG